MYYDKPQAAIARRALFPRWSLSILGRPSRTIASSCAMVNGVQTPRHSRRSILESPLRRDCMESCKSSCIPSAVHPGEPRSASPHAGETSQATDSGFLSSNPPKRVGRPRVPAEAEHAPVVIILLGGHRSPRFHSHVQRSASAAVRSPVRCMLLLGG